MKAHLQQLRVQQISRLLNSQSLIESQARSQARLALQATGAEKDNEKSAFMEGSQLRVADLSSSQTLPPKVHLSGTQFESLKSSLASELYDKYEVQNVMATRVTRKGSPKKARAEPARLVVVQSKPVEFVAQLPDGTVARQDYTEMAAPDRVAYYQVSQQRPRYSARTELAEIEELQRRGKEDVRRARLSPAQRATLEQREQQVQAEIQAELASKARVSQAPSQAQAQQIQSTKPAQAPRQDVEELAEFPEQIVIKTRGSRVVAKPALREHEAFYEPPTAENLYSSRTQQLGFANSPARRLGGTALVTVVGRKM